MKLRFATGIPCVEVNLARAFQPLMSAMSRTVTKQGRLVARFVRGYGKSIGRRGAACNNGPANGGLAVTNCDENDKFETHTPAKVPNMKTKTMYLTSTSIFALLLVSQLAADETNMRYKAQAGSYQLEVDQQILAGADYSHPAERTFSMALDMQTQDQAVTTTLNEVSGTYTAHEMTQRLPTRHLKGKSLELTSADGGRALARNSREDDPRIGLGDITPQGYPISLVLSDILPVLPAISVENGSNWTTEGDLNSLVGWGWIAGKLVSRHTVTGINKENGNTLVSVESTAEATISDPIDNGKYILTRNTIWQFNATKGRLVSLSMNENAYAISKLPQGNVPVHQITTATLSP
jgi:hypothetical protein